MSPSAVFGTLVDASLREAWPHEEHNFTPWLAANLDRISDAIGIPLELSDTEVPVQRFEADILARTPVNDSAVIIENQLEQGDHLHLGQILTYMAGLDAQTVVWVASSFREAHLSAIRWLNEHTVEPYAFFALTVRVVRIGDSPFAPLFEVVERPNNWDREIQEVARDSRAPSSVNALRMRFWKNFEARHADEGALGRGYAASARWWKLEERGLVISRYISKASVGIFVRGSRGVTPEEMAARLAPYAAALAQRLDADFNEESDNFFFHKKLVLDTSDETQWNMAADWLRAETVRYAAVLVEIVPVEDAAA